MIDKLTKKQEKQLIAYREKAFQQAVSTITNRKKAEKWALRLTNGLTIDPEVHWCTSPEEASKIADLLLKSRWDNGYFANDDRPYKKLWNCLWVKATKSLKSTCKDSVSSGVWHMLKQDIRYRLTGRLWNDLMVSIGDNRWRGLVGCYKFNIDLGFKVNSYGTGEFADSFKGTMISNLMDTGWLSFYSFAEKIGVEFSREDSEKLKCYRKILTHCFAIYIMPGHVILVEKPRSVYVRHNTLHGIELG